MEQKKFRYYYEIYFINEKQNFYETLLNYWKTISLSMERMVYGLPVLSVCMWITIDSEGWNKRGRIRISE